MLFRMSFVLRLGSLFFFHLGTQRSQAYGICGSDRLTIEPTPSSSSIHKSGSCTARSQSATRIPPTRSVRTAKARVKMESVFRFIRIDQYYEISTATCFADSDNVGKALCCQVHMDSVCYARSRLHLLPRWACCVESFLARCVAISRSAAVPATVQS